MGGKLIIEITGDASKYKKQLDEVDEQTDQTAKDTNKLHQAVLNRDSFIEKKIDHTVTDGYQKLSDAEIAVMTTSERLTWILKELNKMADLTETEVKATKIELMTDFIKVETQRKLTELKAKATISNTLFALRALTDVLALYSVITDESIDTHFLALISMGLSAAMQVRVHAAVYAATPGGQPIALMLLSLLPVLTGMIGFFKSEQSKLRQNIADQNTQQLRDTLDGIPY
ncbi:MAG: hypothetical protein KAS32_21825 [Candidatus Peribacteraceae bacterium]|nr:hypothetical protein [Candidatus Peribacteraceae bacterium]